MSDAITDEERDDYARGDALRAAVEVATSQHGPEVYSSIGVVDMAEDFFRFLRGPTVVSADPLSADLDLGVPF